MRKWEKKYEEYKNGEPKEKIEEHELSFDELSEKVKQNLANKKEIQAYNKMKRIYEYLPQVENLKDAIDLLEERLNILKTEENARKEQSKIEKLEAEIESDRKKYIEEQKKGNENFDKLEEIQDKQLKLNDMQLKAETNNPEFKDMSKEDLLKEISATKGQIGKCHLAARYFMEGQSKQYIDIKVNKEWKDRKFTSKEPISTKKKDKEKDDNAINSEKSDVTTDKNRQQPIQVMTEGMTSTLENIHKEHGKGEEKTNSILNIEEIKKNIEDEHPWLTRLSKLPLLGRQAKKQLHNYVQVKIDEQEKINALKEKKEQAKSKISSEKKDTVKEFKAKFSLANYDVMYIAEKGIKGIEEKKMEAVKSRYEEMKKRAQDEKRYEKWQEVDDDFDTSSYAWRTNENGKKEIKVDRFQQKDTDEER